MIYKGNLKPRGAGQPLDITWNSETGEFGGPDAQEAEQFVAAVQEDGYVELAPCVNHHFTGELLTPEEVGSILSMYWVVDEVFPTLEPDLGYPDDALS